VLGHNVNLAGKATMGLACMAMLADMIGDTMAGARYRKAAEEFAKDIVDMAKDRDALRLAFDQPGSWSLKYNFIWDRLMGFNLFPRNVLAREIAQYKRRAEPCGIPLDNRSTLTKPEWMLWAAWLTGERAFFQDSVERILRYANTTPNRVPLSDLYLTDSGRKIGFQARSVLGGLFIGLLDFDSR
jgi:transposase